MNTDLARQLIGLAQRKLADQLDTMVKAHAPDLVLNPYHLIQNDLTDALNALAGVRSSDDQAVDRFADALKAKLAAARAHGRGGWDDPARCQVTYLAELLLEQLERPNADPVDVGNFAMFLHNRPGGVEALRAVIAERRGPASS